MAFGFGLDKFGMDNPALAAGTAPQFNTGSGSAGNAGGSGEAGAVSRGPERTESQSNIISAGLAAESGLNRGAFAASSINEDHSRAPGEVKKSEDEFARAAEQGIRNGLTADQVRQMSGAATELGRAKTDEIYKDVADRQGTSDKEITEKQEQQAKDTQQALWGGAGAAIGGAGVLGALDNLTGQNQQQADKQASAGQSGPSQGANPMAGLLAASGFKGQKFDVADMGPTGQFLADHDNIKHGLAKGPEQRQHGAGMGLA